jgi:hypothetical protein
MIGVARSALRITLLLTALTSPASAGVITIRFEGVVIDTLRDGRSGVVDDFDLLPEVGPGDAFSGAYTYEDSVVPQANAFCPPGQCASQAVYELGSAPPVSMQLDIKGARFTFDQTSEPTPFPGGLPAGLSASLEVASQLDLDTYLVTWSGATTQITPDPVIHENVVQVVLAFPLGTLVPQPLPSAPVTTDPLIVPDFSLRSSTPIYDVGFVFVARDQKDPDRVERLPSGQVVVTRGEFRESRISGRLTALAVPEPSGLLWGSLGLTLAGLAPRAAIRPGNRAGRRRARSAPSACR